MPARTRDYARREAIAHPLEHMRVLGPPASGKTTLLVERFFALVHRGESPLIVTYSRESADKLKLEILSRGPWTGGELPVSTYYELACRSLAHMPTVLNDLEEQALLAGLVSRRRKSLKSVYRNLAGTRALRKALLDTFHFLMQNGIGLCSEGKKSGDALASLAASLAGKGRLKDVLSLYSDYLVLLEKHGYATYYDIWYRALRDLDADPGRNPAPGKQVFLVEDFHDVDPGQFELLRRLVPPGGERALNVFGDPTGARFRHRGTSGRYLMEVFPEVYGGTTFELRLRDRGEMLSRMTASILKETLGKGCDKFLPRPGEGEGVCIPAPGDVEARLVSVRDEFAEAAFVAASIEKVMELEMVAPEDIAVIARDKRRYGQILSFVFDQYQIPFDTGKGGLDPAWSLVLSLFEILIDPERTQARERVAGSVLLPKLEEILRNRLGEGDPGGAGEGAGDTGGSRAGGRGGDGESLELVDRFLRALRASKDDPVEALISDVFFALAREVHGSRTVTRAHLRAMEFSRSWRSYVSFAGRVGIEPDLGDFLEMNEHMAGTIPSPGPGSVGFYSCHEAHNRFFRVVFLVGCSETIFPGLPDKDELVPHAELQERLGSFLGEDVRSPRAGTIEDHVTGELGLMLHALMRARNKLVVTAPKEFGGGELPAPSAVFAGKAAAGDIEEAEDLPMPPVVEISSLLLGGDESGTRASGGGLGGADVKKALASADLARLAEAIVERSPATALFRGGPRSPRRFGLERFALSKSSLQAYCRCPRLFFYTKLLRLPEPENVGGTVGNIFHALARDLCSGRPTRIQILGREGEIDRLIREAVENAGETPGTLRGKLMMKRLGRLASGFFAIEKAREEDYRIELSEENFPFEHRGFTFTCRIDRVESMAGGRRIVIDYKTGKELRKAGKLREKALGEECKPRERNWQPPLYLGAVRKCEGEWPAAFSLYLLHDPDKPKQVRLEVVSSEGEAGDYGSEKDLSYLTAGEIEKCLDDAVDLALEIFGERESFPRTEDKSVCYNCTFKGICKR